MGTFAATFLGHQGWLLRSDRTTWLVDPLLREDFGAVHALGYRVYPPRLLDAARLPEVDAVFLTHEHDDHFDIPSLALLDRAIPVFLSSRSSSAAQRILSQMGFAVVRLEPGVVVEQGDLELVPFAGDHLSSDTGDEWDALPISVRHTGGDGGFFSMVDVPLTPRHVAWAKAHLGSPGLVTWSNNAVDFSHMAPYAPSGAGAAARSLAAVRSDHEAIVRGWGQPAATLLCAGGFAFEGERAWLNLRVFSVDGASLCEALSSDERDGPGAPFHAAIPGQTFSMERGRLARVDDATPFLRAAPRDHWPARSCTARADGEADPDYGPATGRRRCGPDERQELEGRLGELAATLVGGVTWRSLHSLLTSEAKGRRPTLAVALRHDGEDGEGERWIYAYDPSSCAFRGAPSADPETEYLAGLSCWATDLLAVLRGDLGPIALQFGRATLWNGLPRRFRFSLFDDLYRASHPLRRPDAFLRRYREVWSGVSETRAVVRGHRIREGH